jgi:UDP-glucuronate decarboxylase
MHLEKRVLVTGGAGFLGSHLCQRLLEGGASVICADNYFTGTRRNIDGMLDHHRFELTRHDITFSLYVEVDQIYNLACPASPIHYQHDPVQTTKTSVHGAINMLGLAKRLRAKILQASTSEVYGDPSVHPQHEEYCGHVNRIGPRSCYDEGKRCAETLFFDYWRQHKLRRHRQTAPPRWLVPLHALSEAADAAVFLEPAGRAVAVAQSEARRLARSEQVLRDCRSQQTHHFHRR